MGRRFPGSAGGGGGGGGGGLPGEFNKIELFWHPGSVTWEKPAGLKQGSRILVHVWGAGGAGSYASNDSARGGGGGGLAVKYIDESSLGATETLTIGTGSSSYTGTGGTSSFGSHCSATGGNSGYNNTDNQGLTNYGSGGMGIGGDENRRGGRGGQGYYSTASNLGGGGGGSAPAPYGLIDGFTGGGACLLYTSPSPRDVEESRMPSSA